MQLDHILPVEFNMTVSAKTKPSLREQIVFKKGNGRRRIMYAYYMVYNHNMLQQALAGLRSVCCWGGGGSMSGGGFV